MDKTALNAQLVTTELKRVFLSPQIGLVVNEKG